MVAPRLVGRVEEVAAIHAAIDATARGLGQCLVVEGMAGIGKSRLLSEGTEYAAGLELSVVTGRATELDRVAPLNVLLGALRPVLPVPPAEIGAGAEHNGFWLIDRLGALIEDQVRTRPMLVVLDDVQWADELTALALRVLVPALASSPVCWVLARRPLPERAPGQEAVDWLLAEGAPRLQLEPLRRDCVAELCSELLGAAPDEQLLAFAERSDGNPFLLGDLLTSLRDAGRIAVTAGRATVTGEELPSSFLLSVEHRLRDLSEHTRALLVAGAVLGRRFTLHEAAGLAGRSAVDLVIGAKEAVRSGALVDDGAALAYRHDLIREAVYNALPEPVRRALHREAAEVVREEGHPVLEVASHLLRGARQADAQAIEVLRSAADQVASTSPGTAAELMLRGLELLDPQDSARPDLVAATVRLLASAGRLAEARELGERALRAGLPEPVEAGLLLGLAEAMKHAGQSGAVLEFTRRALAHESVHESARAQLLASEAHALLQTGELVNAAEVGEQAVRLGRAAGEHSAVVYALGACAVGAQDRGEVAAAIEIAGEAVRLANEVGGAASQWHPRLWLAPALVAADRLNEASAVYEMGQREAEWFGTAWTLPLWHYYRGELHAAAGRLDDAAAEFESGLAVAEQLGALALAPSLQLALARISLWQDEVPQARKYLRRAKQLAEEGVGVVSEDLAWTSALLLDSGGKPDEAAAELAEIYSALPRRLLLLTYHPYAGPQLVRIALRARRPELAAVVARAAGTLAEANPGVPTLVAAGLHADALVRGDLDDLREAVRLYEASPRPPAVAAAYEDAAAAEQTAGNRTEAVGLLESALGLHTTSGAKRHIARVRGRMRRLGVHLAAPAGQRGATSGWHSLTRSELKVARLVAEGLTNRDVAARLFLSPHTVDTHLRHIFAKLDVSSRVEVTRKVLEHGQDGD
ncbi:LuxR C-terminal-related transcriptional regulator [Amycolatopsis roodepoortensis]|uniref:ATP-binding protein n=1 Tax=Amycolatopsis roodepoortensis TaxID=700274 RepID=UPI00214AB715|nr:AAA family ATPase [Amycolatopsis roodepoortensis]UUV31548.1 LuxR C-terminal-related transcriptional regulator [Amycolatopsis roodepoortensis]